MKTRLPIRNSQEPSIGGESESLACFLLPVNDVGLQSRFGRERVLRQLGPIFVGDQAYEGVVTAGEKFRSRSETLQGGRYLLTARVDGKDGDSIVAALNWTDVSGEVFVSNIFVREDLRRRGLASALITLAQSDHPKICVDANFTRSGAALFGYGETSDAQPDRANARPARVKPQLDLRIEEGVRGHFTAFVGKRRVGALASWVDSRGEFVVMDVVVRKDYRRRGVATALYRAAEEGAGKQLKPAISLSDDGFEFWKHFRPEAVAQDLRHRPELIGRTAQKNGREGIITKASGNIAMLTFEDGMWTAIHARDLDECLKDAAPAQQDVLHAATHSQPHRRTGLGL